jgi:deazaflavin-dependent oxidoreductase (nitroreductase family)
MAPVVVIVDPSWSLCSGNDEHVLHFFSRAKPGIASGKARSNTDQCRKEGTRMTQVWRNGRWLWLFALLLSLCVLESTKTILWAQAGKPVTKADLQQVANESNVEITTIGRKSGKPHTKPIWFVYDQGHLYLQAGQEGKTDWYQNLKKNPQITLKIGTLTFTGKAQFIDDPQETERIHNLFRQKYLRARLAGVVGSSIGHGRAVEVIFAEAASPSLTP